MAGIKKSTKDTLDYLNKHPELGRSLYWDDVYGRKNRPPQKSFDFSSNGIKTPYYSSKGWRAKEINGSGVYAASQATLNRSHERIESYNARSFLQVDNKLQRQHELRMKWGPLARLFEGLER